MLKLLDTLTSLRRLVYPKMGILGKYDNPNKLALVVFCRGRGSLRILKYVVF